MIRDAFDRHWRHDMVSTVVLNSGWFNMTW